jgi:T5SS/PEP-CTERM-associated repeat protein
MPRCKLTLIVLLSSLGWSSPALAVDFFWVGPGLGGPGGNFRTAGNWTFTPPPFPLEPAPGGAGDTANFDLGRAPENRYTVTNVNGQNGQMLIHNDSLRLEINDYQLLSADEDNPSFIVGVISGDEADVVLSGIGNATLRTNETVIGLGVASTGELTVDHLQWLVDGQLNVGGRADFVGGTGGDGTMTIQNGSLVASDHATIGDTVGSIGEVIVSNSAWTVDGILRVGSQGIGTLLIQNGGTVSSESGLIHGNSTATIDGAESAWNVGEGLRMFQGSNSTLNIQNGGTVTVGSGDGIVIMGNSSTEITLDSGGILDARGTIAMNTGDFNFIGGTLHVDIFDDHLVNQGGTLAPGQSAGRTNITGNYTHQSAATLQIEIGGMAPGTQHDFMNVEGTASMAGALELALINSFEPAPDDEFLVFNTDTLWLDSFSNVADGQRLATIDGLGSFLVHYGPTSSFNANQVVLSDFLPTLPGDYNHDGSVDAADYVVWRKDPNSFGGDPAGYNTWRAHFGATLGSGSTATKPDVLTAVPEPSVCKLLVAAACVFLGRRCYRKRSWMRSNSELVPLRRSRTRAWTSTQWVGPVFSQLKACRT